MKFIPDNNTGVEFNLSSFGAWELLCETSGSVSFSYKCVSASAVLSGRIEFTTNDPKYAKVEIPVNILCDTYGKFAFAQHELHISGSEGQWDFPYRVEVFNPVPGSPYIFPRIDNGAAFYHRYNLPRDDRGSWMLFKDDSYVDIGPTCVKNKDSAGNHIPYTRGSELVLYNNGIVHDRLTIFTHCTGY